MGDKNYFLPPPTFFPHSFEAFSAKFFLVSLLFWRRRDPLEKKESLFSDERSLTDLWKLQPWHEKRWVRKLPISFWNLKRKPSGISFKDCCYWVTQLWRWKIVFSPIFLTHPSQRRRGGKASSFSEVEAFERRKKPSPKNERQGAKWHLHKSCRPRLQKYPSSCRNVAYDGNRHSSKRIVLQILHFFPFLAV